MKKLDGETRKQKQTEKRNDRNMTNNNNENEELDFSNYEDSKQWAEENSEIVLEHMKRMIDNYTTGFAQFMEEMYEIQKLIDPDMSKEEHFEKSIQVRTSFLVAIAEGDNQEAIDYLTEALKKEEELQQEEQELFDFIDSIPEREISDEEYEEMLKKIDFTRD